jgi:soluble lytic murein transglycosylase-like protein
MTIPETHSLRRARVLLPMLLLSSALASSLGAQAFGMGAAELASLLAGKDTAPALALDEVALGDTGAFGPTAWYYLGRWLDSREPPVAPTKVGSPAAPPDSGPRARLLYRMAYDRTTGLARKASGLALIGRLAAASQWSELLDFSAEYLRSASLEWKAERPRLDALDALGRDAELKSLLARLSAKYPAEAARDAEAFAWFGAASDLRRGGVSWPAAIRRLLLERPASEWTARAWALSGTEPRIRSRFTAEELHALAMRDAVARRDFGFACLEAQLAGAAAMGPAASPAMIADAGKAFLYSGSLKDAEGRFSAAGWTARFYKARFARSLERWDEAAALFRKAVADAPTKADADSCRWYAADSAYRGALAAAASGAAARAPESGAATAAAEAAARATALDELVAASLSWSDPAYFSDLAGSLFRDALRARDWRLIEGMARRLGPRLAPDASARVAYASARAFELSLGPAEPALPESEPAARAAAAAVRFAAIADDGKAPFHYRALAAWRAGLEASFISPDPPLPDPALDSSGETEAFVAGLASFGLCDIALAEARSRRSSLGDESLRRLAALFSSIGRPDCGIRLALDLTSRAGYMPRRSDYELLYPRPYLGEIASLRLGAAIPERLALGLLRSESLFRADVVSSAGAIGLSQLMPATAADQARALGITVYDLRTPKDNLTIGLSHFAALLARADGRPLRAMMAYNAGWGRLRTWSAESGDLPDDLLIEALGIEETRQYCRNILQATVMYGELYYDTKSAETVAELVEGVSGNS